MTGTRICLLAFVCSALALGLSSAATAADNFKISDSFSYTDPFMCTDPIKVDESYDEMVHVYRDSDGHAVRLQFTGFVSIGYTNLTTGATYRPNSSGPGTIDLLSGQTVLRGGNGAFFDSSGIFVATDGRIVLDDGGNVISLTGHVVDVCAKLGSTAVPSP